MAVQEVRQRDNEQITKAASYLGTSFAIEAVREFEVLMTSATDDATLALNADDGTRTIPGPGTAWNASNTDLLAQTPTVRRVGKTPLFEVIVPYAIRDFNYGGRRSVPPLDRDIIYNEYGQPTTVDVDRDSGGNLIRNAAGQVLYVPIKHADLYIQAIRNDDDNLDYSSYFMHTNNASFTLNGKSYAQHTLLLSHVDKVYQEETFENEVIEYFQYIYHFYIRFARGTNDPTTWKEKILNQGTVHKDGTDQVANTDTDGNIITEPLNLDNNGAVQAPGATPYWLASASTYSTDGASRVTMYQEAAFSGLGLS